VVTNVISGTEANLHQKYRIQDYQNKDRVSVCRILLLQWKPKLGRTKPSTEPHAARIGHCWSSPFEIKHKLTESWKACNFSTLACIRNKNIGRFAEIANKRLFK